jgi:hypothetical protein
VSSDEISAEEQLMMLGMAESSEEAEVGALPT